MPSFDTVSEANMVEVKNAIDQANKEISNRFDFKGSKAEIVLEATEIKLTAEDAYKVRTLNEIVIGKLAKRGIIHLLARLEGAGLQHIYRQLLHAGCGHTHRHRGVTQQSRQPPPQAPGLLLHVHAATIGRRERFKNSAASARSACAPAERKS